MSDSGEKITAEAVLAGMTTTALRDHLEDAESKASLAQFIDHWPRAQREQAYWLGIATQIKAEIKRRGAELPKVSMTKGVNRNG